MKLPTKKENKEYIAHSRRFSAKKGLRRILWVEREFSPESATEVKDN